MRLNFRVQGSAAEPYSVSIENSGKNLTALCNCPAGKNGTYCKHRSNLFKGLGKDVVGGDVDRVSEVPNMLIGTDVEESIKHLERLESEFAKIKSDVTKAKKALGKAMRS